MELLAYLMYGVVLSAYCGWLIWVWKHACRKWESRGARFLAFAGACVFGFMISPFWAIVMLIKVIAKKVSAKDETEKENGSKPKDADRNR